MSLTKMLSTCRVIELNSYMALLCVERDMHSIVCQKLLLLGLLDLNGNDFYIVQTGSVRSQSNLVGHNASVSDTLYVTR